MRRRTTNSRKGLAAAPKRKRASGRRSSRTATKDRDSKVGSRPPTTRQEAAKVRGLAALNRVRSGQSRSLSAAARAKRMRRPESPSGKGSSSGARKLSKLTRSLSGPRVSKPVQLQDLGPRQLRDYEESLAVLAAVRRGYAFGFDTQGRFSRQAVRGVRHAAQIIGIPFSKVERYVGSQLFRDRKGRIQVTPADRLPRKMPIPTALGDQNFVVRGSRKASLLAKYRQAILMGDETELQKFKGKRAAGQELITDIRTIQALLDAGAVDPAEMYAAAQGGSAS